MTTLSWPHTISSKVYLFSLYYTLSDTFDFLNNHRREVQESWEAVYRGYMLAYKNTDTVQVV